ncbi:hypothetical protein BH18ACI5_BH18ACI5_28910 [soil metagenome]
MRLSQVSLASSLLVLSLGVTDAAAQRGAVNGLSITPATAQVGATISVTVSGVNPCGAVFVDWGDGTVVTHPISELPTTRTHVYAAAGNYSVTARAMGNCDGEAAGTVRINPAPAPAVRRELTGFFVSSPTAKGEPVNMSLRGEGDCTIDLAFGDGNTQQVSVQLPYMLTHVYAEPRSYNVTASAVSPCQGGRHTARLEVAPGPVAARLGALAIGVNATAGPGATIIDVTGAGNCSYLLDYGDGNRERRTVTLPDRVEHVYPATGTFTVIATAERPCEGRVQETFRAGRARSSIVRLVISPNPAAIQSRVSIAIEGSGTCPVTVDFGDGTDQSIEGTLPLRVLHSYARPGRYEVFAWSEAPCTGDAGAVVQVRR